MWWRGLIGVLGPVEGGVKVWSFWTISGRKCLWWNVVVVGRVRVKCWLGREGGGLVSRMAKFGRVLVAVVVEFQWRRWFWKVFVLKALEEISRVISWWLLALEVGKGSWSAGV